MTDPIRVVALVRDQNADVPSAEKRAQAASIMETINELRALITQVGSSRAASIALTKIEEASFFAIQHVLEAPESQG
jgi:hypothetical protein